ncbi:MAG: DUF4123 domain-containing protein [Sulfurovum sp.]|nr:DUF4123 domain-containing protein [Sulfurovum sp.]
MIEKLFEILNPTTVKYNNLDFKVYGVFDGVKYPMLWSDLEDGVLSYDMLFREDNLRDEMEKVAPFLVELNFDSEKGKEETTSLLESYGKCGCVFVTTPLAFSDIIEKFREVFYIYTPKGDKGFFRFYDPNIFTEVLVQKDTSLIYTLFEKVYAYWCEDLLDVNNCVTQYKYNGQELNSESYSLMKEDR